MTLYTKTDQGKADQHRHPIYSSPVSPLLSHTARKERKQANRQTRQKQRERERDSRHDSTKAKQCTSASFDKRYQQEKKKKIHKEKNARVTRPDNASIKLLSWSMSTPLSASHQARLESNPERNSARKKKKKRKSKPKRPGAPLQPQKIFAAHSVSLPCIKGRVGDYNCPDRIASVANFITLVFTHSLEDWRKERKSNKATYRC